MIVVSDIWVEFKLTQVSTLDGSLLDDHEQKTRLQLDLRLFGGP